MKTCQWCGEQVEHRYYYKSELVCRLCLERNHVKAIDNKEWQALHGWQGQAEKAEAVQNA